MGDGDLRAILIEQSATMNAVRDDAENFPAMYAGGAPDGAHQTDLASTKDECETALPDGLAEGFRRRHVLCRHRVTRRAIYANGSDGRIHQKVIQTSLSSPITRRPGSTCKYWQ